MLQKLTLQVKNMTNDPQYLEYAEKRLGPLETLLKTTDGLRWNLRLSKDGHSKKGEIYNAEAQIKTAVKNYGAETTGSTPYEAIDELKDELSKKIIKHKEKRLTRIRRGALLAKKLFKRGK